jgi:hypothetical protein
MTGKSELKLPALLGGATVYPDIKYSNADTHMIGITFKYAFDQHFLRSSK